LPDRTRPAHNQLFAQHDDLAGIFDRQEQGLIEPIGIARKSLGTEP
jgi:hypothetical protein